MDASLAGAARALAAGDPLQALNGVALRTDAVALALRGIAMAQLGDYVIARGLLRRAARAFGARQPAARARCRVAEAEVALAIRDVAIPPRLLDDACRTLDAAGDRANGTRAHIVTVKRLLLLGQIDAAERLLHGVDLRGAPPMLVASARLLLADVGLRRGKARWARTALDGALAAALEAGIPSLVSEVRHVRASLELPVARLVARGSDRPIALAAVEAVLASQALIVDACRRVVRRRREVVDLARRPTLFTLAQCLASAWPGGATRNDLITRLFEVNRPNESHRARLRVEVGRLRRELRRLARVTATATGYQLTPLHGADVLLLAPPIEGAHAAVLALLADGAAWSTSGLALALGSSQRSVQRALAALAAAGSVRSLGRARTRRWVGRPLAGFTPHLLLPLSPPIG